MNFSLQKCHLQKGLIPAYTAQTNKNNGKSFPDTYSELKYCLPPDEMLCLVIVLSEGDEMIRQIACVSKTKHVFWHHRKLLCFIHDPFLTSDNVL